MCANFHYRTWAYISCLAVCYCYVLAKKRHIRNLRYRKFMSVISVLKDVQG